MKKIAIIGASYLQEPLIVKAKEMGIQTHVFAWAANDVGERIADYFYPISIVEKERILEACREVKIDGVCSIASDLAVVTVNYIAEHMNLIGNGIESTLLSTNKHSMRMEFEKNGDPSPKSILVQTISDLELVGGIEFPVIVKPLDRSGSRGISKCYSRNEIISAIEKAENQGFIKKALVEEFIDGDEYSVECITYKGSHNLLAITKKFTTGSPHFIETGHVEPANLSEEVSQRIKSVVFHALDSLKIRYGASHSEIKICVDGSIKIIEIGARMGGDFIGSTLVEQHTGIDFVKAVIQISLGQQPDLTSNNMRVPVGIRFICSDEDIKVYNKVKVENPDCIVQADVPEKVEGVVTDSSTRHGYFILKADDLNQIMQYMPDNRG